MFAASGEIDFHVTGPRGVGGAPRRDSIGDDDLSDGDQSTEEIAIFETSRAVEGVYHIDIQSASSPEYALKIYSYDVDGSLNRLRLETGTLGVGEVVRIDFNYSLSPAVQLTLDVDKLETEEDGEIFKVKGTFTLGEGNNGIDLLTESVSLSIGSLHMTTPVGSFELDDGTFEFEGEVNGVQLEMEITPLGNDSFAFEADGHDARLSRLVNPVGVRLTIGDDRAKTKVNADL